MAKGRFPVLYWASLGLLALMLAFSGWYFYQNREGVCRNSIAEPMMRDELRRHWKKGQVVALLAPWSDCAASGACSEVADTLSAGLDKLLTDDFSLWVGSDASQQILGRKPKLLEWLATGCDAALPERLSGLGEGNHLLVLPKGCLERLADVKPVPGLILFLKKGAAGDAPGVLACASPEAWSQLD